MQYNDEMFDIEYSYKNVVDTYNIKILKTVATIQISETGGPKMINGDFQLGDIKYNAMFRLVQKWRASAPNLSNEFSSTTKLQDQIRHYRNEKNKIANILHSNPDKIPYLHGLNDKIASCVSQIESMAGNIIMILDNLLDRFYKDLGLQNIESLNKPSNSGINLINKYTFGEIVIAAANNYRHHGEWAITNKLTKRQQKSIKVIGAILDIRLPFDHAHHPFRPKAKISAMSHHRVTPLRTRPHQSLDSLVFLRGLQ